DLSLSPSSVVFLSAPSAPSAVNSSVNLLASSRAPFFAILSIMTTVSPALGGGVVTSTAQGGVSRDEDQDRRARSVAAGLPRDPGDAGARPGVPGRPDGLQPDPDVRARLGAVRRHGALRLGGAGANPRATPVLVERARLRPGPGPPRPAPRPRGRRQA